MKIRYVTNDKQVLEYAKKNKTYHGSPLADVFSNWILIRDSELFLYVDAINDIRRQYPNAVIREDVFYDDNEDDKFRSVLLCGPATVNTMSLLDNFFPTKNRIEISREHKISIEN